MIQNLHKVDNGIELKRCTSCKEWLCISLFVRERKSPDGLAYVCKQCKSIINKRWRIANPEKVRANEKLRNKETRNKRVRERTKTDLKYNLNCRIAPAIRKAIKNEKNGRQWELLVGYSAVDLKRHLEKRFTKGMTWQLFLEGKIHIDHKIPKSAFNYTKPGHEDFKKAWALKNLQPLWAEDNLEKQAKLTKHFQPSLLL